MKKYIIGAFIMLFASTTLTSCSEDDDHAEATVTYFAECTAISFSDTNDETYKDMINKSLDNLKIAGNGSIFTESAKTDVGITQAAIDLCDQQAIKTYSNTIANFTLADIKSNIFQTNKIEQGWADESAITLDQFSIELDLYGVYPATGAVVKHYSKTFY